MKPRCWGSPTPTWIPIEETNVWLSSGPQHQWWPNQKTPATPWEARIDQLELKQSSDGSRDSRKKAIDEVQKIVARRNRLFIW